MRVSGVMNVLARVLIASLLVFLSMIAGPAIAAPPLRADTETTDAAPLRVSVAPDSVLVTADQETLTVSLRLENLTTDTRDVSSIGVFVDPDRVVSEPSLLERLALSELPQSIGAAQANLPASSLGGGESSTLSVDIPTAALGLPASGAAGVYVMFARVSMPGGSSVLTSTPIVWQGSGTDQRTLLHTVVPLLLPNSVDGMPELSTLAELTAADGALTQRVASALSVGATLAIDPRIPAAIAAYGDSAPASSVALLERISESGVPTFALQFADADLAAQAELGLPSPLEPLGFDFISDSAADLAFSYTLDAVAWPSQDSVGSRSVSFLSGAGFSTVLLSSGNVNPSPQSSGTLGALRAVTLESALNDAALRAVDAANEVDQGQATATVAALLALTSPERSPGTPVTLGISRQTAASGVVTSLIDDVAALPWVQSVGFAAVVQQNAELTLLERSVGETRLADLRAALSQEPAIDEYAAVLLEPSFLMQLQRLRILEFFRASLRELSPEYAEVAAQFAERDAQTLRSVHITTTSTTHVVGTETRIPIQLSNELPFAAGVSAEVASTNSSLLVRESRTPFVTIEQNASINVTVPVQARVSAGQTALLVTLKTQDGMIIDEAVLPVTIRSSWETIALVMIGLLVSTFFGFGIWRSVKSRRAAHGTQQHDTQAN